VATSRSFVALIVSVTLLMAIVGMTVPDWFLNQLLVALARGLAVLGLMVLLRTGLVSFGHALYLGLGAYTVVLLNRFASVTDAFLLLFTAAVISTLVGVVVGFIVRRHKRIFFAMLNLAISMIFYGLIIKSDWLGSSDGFSVKQASFLGVALSSGSVTRLAIYYVLLAVIVAAIFGVHWYLKTTLGRLSEAVRDNDIRVEYLGYSPERVVHLNYILSAALAGISGAFMAIVIGQVDPDSLIQWTVSGELVFVTVLSGTGHVLAPFIGSVLFEMLKTVAFENAPQLWNMIIGFALLTIILFLPEGFSSILARIRQLQRQGNL
jgi:ABC-type branched-subunit amino acid transport system permease subunit